MLQLFGSIFEHAAVGSARKEEEVQQCGLPGLWVRQACLALNTQEVSMEKTRGISVVCRAILGVGLSQSQMMSRVSCPIRGRCAGGPFCSLPSRAACCWGRSCC